MAEKTKKASGPLRKKGGTRFPRINLAQATDYAVKLAAKTHTGPQPASIILPGVFNTKPENADGQIRASALKQFGFLKGDASAYAATDLAKALPSAEGSTRLQLLQRACLAPALFATLFKTYHGDRVSLAKIKQQASSEKVHPDSLDSCATVFADSAVFAGLAAREGDELVLAAGTAGSLSAPNDAADTNDPESTETSNADPNSFGVQGGAAPPDAARETKGEGQGTRPEPPAGSARAVIHVNFDIDSSFDTEKLAKQLELLRRYGAL